MEVKNRYPFFKTFCLYRNQNLEQNPQHYRIVVPTKHIALRLAQGRDRFKSCLNYFFLMRDTTALQQQRQAIASMYAIQQQQQHNGRRSTISQADFNSTMSLHNFLPEENDCQQPRPFGMSAAPMLAFQQQQQAVAIDETQHPLVNRQPTSFAFVDVSPEQPVELTLVETETQRKHVCIYWQREQKYLEALDAIEKHQQRLLLDKDCKEERMQEEEEIRKSRNATALFGKGYSSGVHGNEETSRILYPGERKKRKCTGQVQL